MEIDGQVTISLKTFNQLQDRAKQADELKKRMRDLQEEITDIIDQIDETEAEPIFREIDDSNMTDKQIQKRFDEAIAKFRIILDPEKTKRLIQKYIEKDRSDSHADVKNASRKVTEWIDTSGVQIGQRTPAGRDRFDHEHDRNENCTD